MGLSKPLALLSSASFPSPGSKCLQGLNLKDLSRGLSLNMICALLLCIICLQLSLFNVYCQRVFVVDVAAFYEVSSSGAQGTVDLSVKEASPSISIESLVLLDEISLRATIVCASISNVASMQSEQKSFPMVNWWILEQGGKIFSRQLDSKGNHVVAEDLSYLAHTKKVVYQKDWAALSAFESELRAEGAFHIDSMGYDSMFIVRDGSQASSSGCADVEENHDERGSSISSIHENDGASDRAATPNSCRRGDGLTLKSLEERIPSLLTYTYSNGALIVQVRGLGKLTGIQWLTKKLADDGGDLHFLFMGAEENDIDAASKASHAFLGPPKGKKMLSLVQDSGSSTVGKLTTTSHHGTKGSAQLLHSALEKLL